MWLCVAMYVVIYSLTRVHVCVYVNVLCVPCVRVSVCVCVCVVCEHMCVCV